MWDGGVPDKAGRGALCSEIDQLVKAITKAVDGGDDHEARRLQARLTDARARFHRLYDYKPLPPEVAHERMKNG